MKLFKGAAFENGLGNYCRWIYDRVWCEWKLVVAGTESELNPQEEVITDYAAIQLAAAIEKLSLEDLESPVKRKLCEHFKKPLESRSNSLEPSEEETDEFEEDTVLRDLMPDRIKCLERPYLESINCRCTMESRSDDTTGLSEFLQGAIEDPPTPARVCQECGKQDTAGTARCYRCGGILK